MARIAWPCVVRPAPVLARRRAGAPEQQQAQHDGSEVEKSPERAQRHRLNGKPAQALHGPSGQCTQARVAHYAARLEAQ